MLLTNEPSRAETAVCTCARENYGAISEGARRPITSPPHVAHDACVAPPEKACPLRTAAATTAVLKWSGSLQSKGNPPRDQSQGLEEPTL
jgi:hypothetical protein